VQSNSRSGTYSMNINKNTVQVDDFTVFFCCLRRWGRRGVDQAASRSHARPLVRSCRHNVVRINNVLITPALTVSAVKGERLSDNTPKVPWLTIAISKARQDDDTATKIDGRRQGLFVRIFIFDWFPVPVKSASQLYRTSWLRRPR